MFVCLGIPSNLQPLTYLHRVDPKNSNNHKFIDFFILLQFDSKENPIALHACLILQLLVSWFWKINFIIISRSNYHHTYSSPCALGSKLQPSYFIKCSTLAQQEYGKFDWVPTGRHDFLYFSRLIALLIYERVGFKRSVGLQVFPLRLKISRPTPTAYNINVVGVMGMRRKTLGSSKRCIR